MGAKNTKVGHVSGYNSKEDVVVNRYTDKQHNNNCFINQPNVNAAGDARKTKVDKTVQTHGDDVIITKGYSTVTDIKRQIREKGLTRGIYGISDMIQAKGGLSYFLKTEDTAKYVRKPVMATKYITRLMSIHYLDSKMRKANISRLDNLMKIEEKARREEYKRSNVVHNKKRQDMKKMSQLQAKIASKMKAAREKRQEFLKNKITHIKKIANLTK